MISNWLSAALARRNIHYGWVMVAVTFLTALITAGTVGAPGVFIVPLQKEFGWTTAEISSALSIRFILFGLMAPFAAALMNRYGLRNVTLLALLIVVSGLVASLAMTQVWQLMLLWGVVIGLGTGMTALVLGATIAARWFAARRGLVVGILTASVATGQLVFLPLLASLTDHYGWRIALALICVMLGVPPLPCCGHARPPERCRPAGLWRRRRRARRRAPPSRTPVMAAALATLARCLEVGVFWILFATFFICGASTNGLIQTHFIPMCADFGIPPVQAAQRAGRDGHVRFRRHRRLGLAVGPLRQPLAAVLVLRAARPLAAVPAVHHLLALRPVAVRDVLRARLDRDRAADGAADRRSRSGASAPTSCSAGSSPAISSGAASPPSAPARRGPCCRRYLPAFFVAGALCLVAAVMVLAISRPAAKAAAA